MITKFHIFKIFEAVNDSNEIKRKLATEISQLNLKNLKDFTIKKASDGEFLIHILTENALLAKKQIEEIANKYRNVERDFQTNDILSHGLYIEVEVPQYEKLPSFIAELADKFATKTFAKFYYEIITDTGGYERYYTFQGFEDTNIKIEMDGAKITVDVRSIDTTKNIFFGFVSDYLGKKTKEKMFDFYKNYCRNIFIYSDASTYLEIKEILNGSTLDNSILENKQIDLICLNYLIQS